jgi:hypothetical protein
LQLEVTWLRLVVAELNRRYGAVGWAVVAVIIYRYVSEEFEKNDKGSDN